MYTYLFKEMQKQLLSSTLFSDNCNMSEYISVALIGRPIPERRIDQVMDFDIVIVLKDPMTKKKHNEVKRIFENLQNHATDNIAIMYQIADGPIKPFPLKKVNLFFHVLLHTVKSYKKSPLILVKNSWQYEEHTIIGLPLAEIQKIPEIKLDTLLDGKLGIRHCKELILSHASAYLEWLDAEDMQSMDMVLTPILFKENCEILEICYYSVLRGASNSLRYILGHSKDIGIDVKDMQLFSQVFHDFKHKELPLNYCYEKIKFRQVEWHPNNQDVIDRLNQTMEFLTSLEIDIEKRSSIPKNEYCTI